MVILYPRGTAMEREKSLQSYLNWIEKFPPLSKEETETIWKKYLLSKERILRNQLLNSNLRIPVRVAFKYRTFYSRYLDLIQEGNLGLIQGLDKFNDSYNVPLPCYLSFWAKAYIKRFIMNNFKIVKVATSNSKRTLYHSLNKEKSKLESQGKDCSALVLSKLFELPESEIKEMMSRLSSYDVPIEPEESKLADDEEAGPDSITEKKLNNNVLSELILEFKEDLTERKMLKHLVILNERLLSESPETLENLGLRDDMQISKQRAKQIEDDIKEKLKKFLEGQDI